MGTKKPLEWCIELHKPMNTTLPNQKTKHPSRTGLLFHQILADDGQRESLRDFTCIESDFYPQLHSHHEHVFDDWVAEDNEALKEGES